jgi:hypothetical protein
MGEADEASVLDAAALALAHREYHAFGQRGIRREIEVVIEQASQSMLSAISKERDRSALPGGTSRWQL